MSAAPRDLVMAVDVGSTSARAGIFTRDGALLARGTRPFAVHRPAPDFAEHDSAEIWAAVCGASRAALAEARIEATRIAGLAFDATCSLVALDAGGRPVGVSPDGDDRWNVIMWADHRAVAEADEITATGHRALDFVGGVMSPEMELPKLLWLRRHAPARWARIGLALDLADFLLWRATGRVAVSACTVTCKWTYLNHEPDPWPRDLFARLGLDDLERRAALPARARPIGEAAGTLASAAAAELGLTPDCVAGVGLIDAHAGGLGLLGATLERELDRSLAVIAGTSTCHMAVSRDARPIRGVWGPYLGAMMPGLWLNEGGQSATGALLDHIIELHAEGRALGADRHERVGAEAARLLAAEGPAMLGDLQVLPDFHGNRSPLADPAARGAIHGLTLDASFSGLARLWYAAAVGVALGTRHVIDAMNAAGYAIDGLHLTGGHAASELLVQLYADATGCEVVLPAEPDGVLLGTATVAAAACRIHPSLAAAGQAMVRAGRAVRPRPALREFFDGRYRAFMALHEQARALRALTG